MKIRESFVTNSSSSSYIIAKKKTASEEEIKTAIENKYYKNKEEYLNLLGNIIEEYNVDLSDYEGTDYYGEAPLVKAYIKEENVDEKLKAENQLEWVQKMNNIKNRAEEIVCNEIIYT